MKLIHETENKSCKEQEGRKFKGRQTFGGGSLGQISFWTLRPTKKLGTLKFPTSGRVPPAGLGKGMVRLG